MEESSKISASQLFLLLFLSRAFSLAAYSPAVQGDGERITLFTTLLSGLLQYLLLTAGLFLCKRRAGFSPLLVPESSLYRLQSGLYWLCAMAVCVYTAVNFIAFATDAVYDRRYGWVVAATFLAAGALAVSQGLEGLARGGGILAALLGLGCAVIALGLWEQYDWLNLTFRFFGPEDTLAGVWQGFAMNGELFALLLLLPYLRKAPGPLACAGWVGGITLASLAVQLMTMLTLGSYGARKTFPVFTAVTSAGFRTFQRLDPVFLVIWVALGLVKLAVFLGLASSLAPKVFLRPWSAAWAWANGGIGLALALLLWNGPGKWRQGFYLVLSAGVLTLLGVLLLPLAGKLWEKGEKRK